MPASPSHPALAVNGPAPSARGAPCRSPRVGSALSATTATVNQTRFPPTSSTHAHNASSISAKRLSPTVAVTFVVRGAATNLFLFPSSPFQG